MVFIPADARGKPHHDPIANSPAHWLKTAKRIINRSELLHPSHVDWNNFRVAIKILE